MSLPIKPWRRLILSLANCIVFASLAVTWFGCFNHKEPASSLTAQQIEEILDSANVITSTGTSSSLELFLDDMGNIPIDLKHEDENSVEWLFMLGKEYVNRGEHVLATEYMEQALDLIEHFDSDIEFKLLILLEETYKGSQEMDKAERCVQSLCRGLDPTFANDSIMIIAHLRACYFYNLYALNLDSAFAHIDSALVRCQRFEDNVLTLQTKLVELEVLACAGQLGDVFEALEGLEYLVHAIPISATNKLSFVTRADYWFKLASSYWEVNQLTKANEAYLQALRLVQALPPVLKSARDQAYNVVYLHLANVQRELGNHTLAITYLDSILQNKPSSTPLTTVGQALSIKMDIYLELGYPDDSIKSVFATLSAEAMKEISEKSNKELLTLKENNRKTRTLIQEKTDLEYKQLSLQRDYAYLIIIFLAFTLGFAYFYWRENKLRVLNENDLIRTKNRLLSGQLTPHFIHNSLHAVMLSIEDCDPTAYEYLSGLSKLLRHTFSAYQKDKICLSDEINMLKKYVRLEQIRKGEGLISLNIDLDPTLDVEHIFVTPMLIQPLLENAIKNSKPKELNDIIININPYKQNLLKCIIADTGIGIQKVMTQFPKEHSLYYIDSHMTKLAKEKGLYMEPRHQGLGTRAVLILEYILEDLDHH